MEPSVSAMRPAQARALSKPRAGGSIWPEQHCPVFAPRAEGLGFRQACWFCQYANFHLRERIALDVGVCCWPKAQIR